MLAMGDALCVALLDRKGFKEKDFAFYHPGGLLGKRLLLQVDDIMRKGSNNPLVKENALVKDVLLKITKARAGSASVIDNRGRLIGIFTDGDLRRHMDSKVNIANKKVRDVMTKNPEVVHTYDRVDKAVRILREQRYGALPVLNKQGLLVGILSAHDLLGALEEQLGNPKESREN